MPRVHHVKSARKDNPVAKKGESYYWWKFRYGGKRYSKTPRPGRWFPFSWPTPVAARGSSTSESQGPPRVEGLGASPPSTGDPGFGQRSDAGVYR